MAQEEKKTCVLEAAAKNAVAAADAKWLAVRDSCVD
jgi:hypothetical protein